MEIVDVMLNLVVFKIQIWDLVFYLGRREVMEQSVENLEKCIGRILRGSFLYASGFSLQCLLAIDMLWTVRNHLLLV
jgi:hypothetical protein